MSKITPIENGTISRDNQSDCQSCWYFYGYTRFVVMMIVSACLTLLYSNPITLNFTVICMKDVIDNRTGQTHWLEDSTKISAAFSAVAVGTFIGSFPIVTLFHRFGLRYTLLAYGLVSTFSTALLPISVNISFYAVILIRVLQGFGQAVVFSIQGSVVEKWSTISGMGLFLSVLAAYIQTAPTLTMPLAAFCCESSLTWRALYYINALITLALFVVFFLFYTDSPEDNRFVSEAELKLIKTGKHPTVRSKVPYKAILKDPSVWSSLLGIFSGVLGAVFLIIFGPTYLNKALNFDVKSTGIATALPFFLALFGKLGVGHISDKLTFMSAKRRLQMFGTISQGMTVICYIVLSQTTSKIIAQIFYTSAIFFCALNIAGPWKCLSMVVRQHNHFPMSIATMESCLIVLLSPVLVGFGAPNNTVEEWSRIYLIVGIIIALFTIPFIFFADSEPAPYTKPDWNNNKPKEISPSFDMKEPRVY